MTTVVVADDQPVICAGFAALLHAQPDLDVVGTAADGRELVALVDECRPDVALVDVRMPELDGIEATRLITRDHDTRVLILTTFDLDAYVYDAIRAGASGFLLKDVTAERLVDGVRMIADGSMLLGPAVSRRLVADFANGAARPPETVTLAPLSPREREVFDELARGRSNAEIAAALHISAETVKSHVAEVLRKLGLRDRIQAVVFAYEHGLVRPSGCLFAESEDAVSAEHVGWNHG
jgi:DNA-binding NarL/FixJ family response regulator